MAGIYTRRKYDDCAFKQDIKQSTDSLELVMDITKYVNCNNLCQPAKEYRPQSASLVDIESSMWGLDKVSSRCETAKHPFCGPSGCMLTNDARVPSYMPPFACERGPQGGPFVQTHNTQMPNGPGYNLPNPNICSRTAQAQPQQQPQQRQNRNY